MATASKKRKLVNIMAMYFAEKGRVLSPKEYDKDPNKPPLVTRKEINKTVGSWDVLLKMIRIDHPELWKLTQPKVEDPLTKLRASTIEK